MVWIALALAVLIGVALGLLGGGGSILTVPLLVYVVGQEPRTAVATSLLVVAATSALAAVSHARAGRVRWRTAGVFGAAGMVGAYLGGRLGATLPGTVLLLAFGVLLVVTSVAMLRPRTMPSIAPDEQHSLPVLHILAHGLVVGLVTGLVGAGGGFLVVPALVLLGRVPMHTAVGTSLVIIAMKSVAGLAGYLSSTPVDWALAGGIVAAAALGAALAARWSDRIDEAVLRRVFGWFVLVVGGAVLIGELPPELRANPLSWLAVLAVFGGAVTIALRRPATPAPSAPAPRSGDDPPTAGHATDPTLDPTLDPTMDRSPR